MGDVKTKVHEIRYVSLAGEGQADKDSVIAVSTEDRRVLFFSRRTEDVHEETQANGKAAGLPTAKLIT